MQFSGIPHRPKPPSIRVLPLAISFMASSAPATTLFNPIDAKICANLIKVYYSHIKILNNSFE
jgi:hypothetical protein